MVLLQGGIPTKRPHQESGATSTSFAPGAELCSGIGVGFLPFKHLPRSWEHVFFFVGDGVTVKSSRAGGCRVLQELVLWNKQSKQAELMGLVSQHL